MVVRSSGTAILLEELSESLSQELRLGLAPVRLLDPTDHSAHHRHVQEEVNVEAGTRLIENENDHENADMELLHGEMMTTKNCRLHGEREHSALKSKLMSLLENSKLFRNPLNKLLCPV